MILKPCRQDNLFIDLEMECLSIRSAILKTQQNCQAYSTLPLDPVIASTHLYVTLNSNTTCGNNTNVLQVYDTKDLTNPKLIHSRTLTQKALVLYR
jgi:hypothetical protein